MTRDPASRTSKREGAAMSWGSNNALRTLRTHTRMPVAPQVAARLDHFAHGDQSILRELAGSLTPEQLRGGSVLPDPLPYVPAMRSNRLDQLSTSERRVLLLAALSRSQRLDDLLDAAAVEIDVLLFSSTLPALTIDNGRVRLVDERLRAEIVHLSDPFELRRTHEALARASRRRGARAAATWHAASATESKSRATLVADLVRLAEGHLAAGDAASAHRIARAAIESSNGDMTRRAWAAAGLGAFWCGNLDDAEVWLTRAVHGRPAGVSEPASAALEAIQLLRAGPDGPMYSRERTAEVFAALLGATTSRADREGLTQLARIADAVFDDARLADSLQAQLFLTTSRNAAGVTPGSLTPHTEAHIVMMQIAFQSQANDRAAAAALLLNAIPRLPLVHAAGGIAASYVRILSAYAPALDENLAEAFDSIVPGGRLRYDGDGSALGHDAQVGVRSAAASRLTAVRPDERMPVGASQPLSARQDEVLRLLSAGLSNKEIGFELGISPRTIEVHLTQIYQKYEVRSRSELMSVLFGRKRRRI